MRIGAPGLSNIGVGIAGVGRSVPAMQKTSISTGRPSAAMQIGRHPVAPAPPGRRFPVLRIDHLRCPVAPPRTPHRPPWPATARRAARGPDGPRERRIQDDHRTAAFEADGQLDPRQPPVARAPAAQVHECPICRVKRAYPRDDGSVRGPQRHRPVAHPARHPDRCGQLGQDVAMRQRRPQAGNARKAGT